MASYASLAVFTRELSILVMWAGQLLCEASNYLLKHLFKQSRPNGSSPRFPLRNHRVVHLEALVLTLSFFLSVRAADLAEGYGFPSSHSQYMAYFATFLICHVRFRHRFAPMGSKLMDQVLSIAVVIGLIAWAGGVAYSRWVFSSFPRL